MSETQSVLVASITQDPSGKKASLVITEIKPANLHCRGSKEFDLNGHDGLEKTANSIVALIKDARLDGLTGDYILIDRSVSDFLIDDIKHYLSAEGMNIDVVNAIVTDLEDYKVEGWELINKKLMLDFMARNSFNIRLVPSDGYDINALKSAYAEFKETGELHFMLRAWFIAIYHERDKFLPQGTGPTL